MTVWGVRVNEVGIFACGLGADWWVQAIGRWEISGRALCLGLSPAGGVWFLPGGAKDDAEFMRDHIVEHGVHPKMVKIMTQAKAEQERDSRQAFAGITGAPDAQASPVSAVRILARALAAVAAAAALPVYVLVFLHPHP